MTAVAEPIKVVQLRMTVADVTSGPTLAYTPVPGELVLGARAVGWTVADTPVSLTFGPLGSGTLASTPTGSGDTSDLAAVLLTGAGTDSASENQAIYAGLSQCGGPLFTTWAASTTYGLWADQVGITAAGHVWGNTGDAGTSGSSAPNFAAHIGGTVNDGSDIVWSDYGALPTVGAFTAWLLVGGAP